MNPSINALCVVNDIRNVEEFLSNMRRGFNKAMGISRKEIIFNLTPGVTTKRICNISTNAKSILETYSKAPTTLIGMVYHVILNCGLSHDFAL